MQTKQKSVWNALLSVMGVGTIAAALIAVGGFSPRARAGDATGISGSYATDSDDANYDRLDGTGASGKRVNVIEWEGNLEVHVYPAGGLAGLGLKLDKTNKNKPVMVLAFRFDGDPSKKLTRRAILGIDLHDNFKVYKDPSTAPEYDKLIITNNGLPKPLVAFNVDPEPTQLYPDGHPALAKAPDSEKPKREPATNKKEKAPNETSTTVDDNGTIKPFFMGDDHAGSR